MFLKVWKGRRSRAQLDGEGSRLYEIATEEGHFWMQEFEKDDPGSHFFCFFEIRIKVFH